MMNSLPLTRAAEDKILLLPWVPQNRWHDQVLRDRKQKLPDKP